MRSIIYFISLSILAKAGGAIAAGGGGTSGGGGGGSKGGGSGGGGGGSGGGKGGGGGGGGGKGGGGSGGGGGGSRPSRPMPKTNPSSPDYDPDDPGDPGDWTPAEYDPLQYVYLPAQEQVQEVIGSLELSFNSTNSTVGSGDVSKVVAAILQTPTCTPTATDSAARYTSAPASITQACTPKSLAFTPTTTLAATAYAACIDYASIVKSCASATSSFYNLPASQQASCACFKSTTTSQWCTAVPSTLNAPNPTVVSTGSQPVAVMIRATARFDDAAYACQNYFAYQGYSKLAGILAGKTSKNETVIGADFCANINGELQATFTQTAAYRTAEGLPYTISPSAIGTCVPSAIYNVAPRVVGLTRFNRMVLAAFPVLVTVFSCIAFS